MIVSFFIAHSLIVEAYQAIKEYFNAEDKADKLSPPTGSTDSAIIRQTPVSSDEETPEEAAGVDQQIPVSSDELEEAAGVDLQILVSSDEEEPVSSDEEIPIKMDMTGKTESEYYPNTSHTHTHIHTFDTIIIIKIM
ncbi:MAG: hypothetical protein ACRDDA_08785 [Aeromonas sp.]